jgi:hypothetical protein
MKDFSRLKEFHSLAVLDICRNQYIQSFPEHALESLSELILQETGIYNLDFKNCRSLGRIVLHENSCLRSIDSLSDCKQLRTIIIENCPMIKTLGSENTSLPKLKFFSAMGVDDLRDINFIKNSPLLETLRICGCQHIQKLDEFYGKSLRTLHVSSTSIEDLSCFSENIDIGFLIVRGNRRLSSLEFARHYSKITFFDCSECPLISDFSLLESSSQSLQYLIISHCPGLINMDAFKDCTSLKIIIANDCMNLLDISAVSGILKNLEHSRFDGCPNLERV